MLTIEFDQTGAPKEERLEKTLLRSIESAFEAEIAELPEGIIAVAYVSDERMQELNREYRNKDATTDVLSFSYLEEGDEAETIGDVVMSYDQVVRQQKKGIRYEIIMLLVHGILHVLGHDHMKKDEASNMFALQDKIIKRVV